MWEVVQSLTTSGQDLEGTQKELEAALEYFDKLKPSCVDASIGGFVGDVFSSVVADRPGTMKNVASVARRRMLQHRHR